MKTRATELFGCRYPVLLSGMTGISNPELVAAVCNAGGLGILATADLNAEQTRSAITEIRTRTDAPFGANVPLIIPGAEEKIAILIEETVSVVNYTLGKGDRLIAAVHQYGGHAVATVTNASHALSAQKSGVDALIVTGHEAAAHGGEVTSLVLIPQIADSVSVPVIAAGGFADGRGLAAALALGADGIAMGTRFMNTKESPAHANMKTMSNERSTSDTIYTDKLDGLPCRAAISPGATALIKDRLYLLKAVANSRHAARAYGFPWIKAVAGILLAGATRSRQLARMANAYKAITLAIDEGDTEKGLFLMGQVTGLMKETLSVETVMKNVITEACVAQDMLTKKMGQRNGDSG
ncbi:MAG: nitronate monooxygenase [Thermodesulfobacteriota bacterium]|nr:nitronate monooxygenase [Thermodesulfobacteriota bacterium]